MRSELTSFVKRKYLIACLLLLSLTIVYSAVNFSAASRNYTDGRNSLPEYSSFDELSDRIEETRQLIEYYEAEGGGSTYYVDKLKDEIMIYSYIIENQIPSGTALSFDTLISAHKNWFSYTYLTLGRMYIPMIAIFAFISLLIFSSEFNDGTYRLIYQKNTRRKIVRNKYLFFLTTCAVSFVIMFIGVHLYGFMINTESTSEILVIINNGKTYGIRYFPMLITIFFSSLVWMLMFCTPFFALSVIFNGMIKSAISMVLYFAAVIVIIRKFPGVMTEAYFNQFMNLDWSVTQIIIHFVLFIIFIVLFYQAAVFIFERKNLAD